MRWVERGLPGPRGLFPTLPYGRGLSPPWGCQAMLYHTASKQRTAAAALTGTADSLEELGRSLPEL